MKQFLALFLLWAISLNAIAVDTLTFPRYGDNSFVNKKTNTLTDSLGREWNASVVYTSDGNGNVSAGTMIKGATDGTNIGNTGNKLKVSDKPQLYDIAAFSIAGHTPVYLQGYASAVNAARVDIWDVAVAAEYVFPAAPIQMQIVSTSASDAAAGTGIRTVDIEYLDNTYAAHTITMTMNGTTPVLTVPTNILRVNSFHAMTTGSAAVAVGAISLQAVGGAVTYSRMGIGVNFARQAIYTVPLGKTLYLKSLAFGTTTAAAGHSQNMTIRTTSSPAFELTPGVFMFKFMALLDNASLARHFDLPIAVPATADVKATCQSDGANAAACVASIEGWIE